jgi:hypothetical protein
MTIGGFVSNLNINLRHIAAGLQMRTGSFTSTRCAHKMGNLSQKVSFNFSDNGVKYLFNEFLLRE